MFWHGLSLVSSRLKGASYFIQSMVFQRERNIGQFECVLGDDRHHRSMDCSFHWKSNTCLCFDQAVDWLRVKPRGFNGNLCRGNLILLGQLILFFFVAIHYTMRPHVVGEVAAAVLCWFVGFRRGACSLPVSPLTPPLSWHPLVHPFIFPLIHLFAQNGSSL